MKYFVGIYLAAILVISGCSFNVTEVQSISIEIYPDVERNSKLAEDLIYYDFRYVASKVSSFNESTAKGVQLGYFVRSSDGKSSYRITYNMKIPAVAKNISSLKAEFDNFVTKQAVLHASKETLFDELSPIGEQWAEKLFKTSPDEIVASGSNLLREKISTDQLSDILEALASEYGTPVSTDFVRAQYYEAFSDVPESISLHYLQAYENNKKAIIRVSYHQEGKQWKVIGFGVQPHS